MILGRLYIIHFDMLDGSHRHYVGITRRSDLMKRMREHKANPETPEVKELFTGSAKRTIFEIVRNGTGAQEQYVKDYLKTEDPSLFCPVCYRMHHVQKAKDDADPQTSAVPWGLVDSEAG